MCNTATNIWGGSSTVWDYIWAGRTKGWNNRQGADVGSTLYSTRGNLDMLWRGMSETIKITKKRNTLWVLPHIVTGHMLCNRSAVVFIALRTKVNVSACKKQLWTTCHFQHPMQYIAWIKSWGTQSSCLHLLLSDLSLAKLLPTPCWSRTCTRRKPSTKCAQDCDPY